MKPTILIFSHFYLPGTNAGGPIKSISNIVDSLSNHFIFKIITLDRDFKDKYPYKNIELNKWITVGNAQVYYISPSLFNFIKFIKIIKLSEFEFYYLNSFFDPTFTFLPLILRYFGIIKNKPVLVAPRGEFSNSALKIKWWKKKPYLFIMKHLLIKNIIWQASTALEAADISENINNIKIDKIDKIVKIAPDLVGKNSNIIISRNITSINFTSVEDANNKVLNICFLSRISPMKNLDFLLKTLLKVKVKVILNIHGPSENLLYLGVCKDIVDQLPSNIEVNFHGAYEQYELNNILKRNDIFFLPTKGENFGHVIFEALAAGIPVLISDRTPWLNLEASNAGWIGSLDDPEYFVNIIEMIADLDKADLFKYRLAAYEYALNFSNNDTSLAENINLFEYMSRLN